MRVLVDGNNLLHIVGQQEPDHPPGRTLLCATLSQWAILTRADVHVVFDGPTPTASRVAQITAERVELTFSGLRSADDVIDDLLQRDSAARLLTVVSSDREVMGAARRRRATAVGCAEFWQALRRRLERPPPGPPIEPPEKRGGLAGDSTAEWLREFGFVPSGDDEASDEDSQRGRSDDFDEPEE